ncbi:MAG: ATP-binding cassette domain-containing protein, partial [Pseudomonadota bacterium]|nr:ATP-binding cassette domain-containing protein [Pseudomonadota bacterium]
RYMGYVLQQGGLLPFMTARENIRLPAELFSVEESHDVDELASILGIESCLDKRPSSLSVGERQRVSIARAIFHRPQILIADEPTASIDASNATQLAELLLSVVQRYKVALLVATHDQSIVSAMQLEPLTLEIRSGDTGSVTTIKE